MFYGGLKLIRLLIKISLKQLGSEICDVPDSFAIGKQAAKIFDDRRKMSGGGLEINWGFAETMAYATLLSEEYPNKDNWSRCKKRDFFS
jgi:2-oxoglutarate dehydrogenase complex dehydrogenase (E1) component-like enzyme